MPCVTRKRFLYPYLSPYAHGFGNGTTPRCLGSATTSNREGGAILEATNAHNRPAALATSSALTCCHTNLEDVRLDNSGLCRNKEDFLRPRVSQEDFALPLVRLALAAERYDDSFQHFLFRWPFIDVEPQTQDD